MSDEYGNQIPGIFKGAAEKQRENALFKQMMDAQNVAQGISGISNLTMGQASGKGLTVAAGSGNVLIDGDLRVKGKIMQGNYDDVGDRFKVREICNGYIVLYGRAPGDRFKEYYCKDLTEVGQRVAACCAEAVMKE